MSIILKQYNYDTGQCECRLSCCSIDKLYEETYGFDVCPNVSGGLGATCFPSDLEPSCAGNNISGTLTSDEFSVKCRSLGQPKVDVIVAFDDYGTITGDGEFLTCDNVEFCQPCGVQGTIKPFLTETTEGKCTLSVQYSATNAYWGGPYGIGLYCVFYFG